MNNADSNQLIKCMIELKMFLNYLFTLNLTELISTG